MGQIPDFHFEILTNHRSIRQKFQQKGQTQKGQTSGGDGWLGGRTRPSGEGGDGHRAHRIGWRSRDAFPADLDLPAFDVRVIQAIRSPLSAGVAAISPI